MPKTDRTGMNVSWPGLGRDDPPYRLGKEGAWEDAERKHGDVRKQTGQMPGSGKSRFRKMRRQAAVPSVMGQSYVKDAGPDGPQQTLKRKGAKEPGRFSRFFSG